MRLLNVHKLTFAEFPDDKTPMYAIASHRWGSEEVTLEDVREGCKKSSAGYQKVQAFARFVREQVASVDWLWIDTCCINRESDAELSYAINSMFKWYRNAQICLARLAAITQRSDIGQDEWFCRGWTLQELLAPRLVVFLTRDWEVIGIKGSSFHPRDNIGSDLGAEIANITRIPERILNDWGASVNMRVEDKMRWMDNRKTTREEDMSYALFGIVGVTPGANYGEGAHNARNRLLAAIRQREINEWLRPPDPWTNHEFARKLREPQTGEWLLQTEEYQAWKSGRDQHLWLYGGAGCGKTVLCSTAVEDVQTYCQGKNNFGHAIFYFSFLDERKQTYRDLLISLVAQLGNVEPAFSMLQQIYDKSNKSVPGQRELENILRTAVGSYDQIFCHFDALDECPEADGVRQRTMENIERLLRQASNIHLIATGRDTPGIRDFMDRLGAKSIRLTGRVVDPDIRQYVSMQLAHVPRFARLDVATKELIAQTLTEKADGMFRWVFCQIEQLTNLKSTRPSTVKAALRALPRTLDETYDRMLQNIAPDDQPYALTFLRWLTYAQRPLSLAELAEASIIVLGENATGGDSVATDNPVGWGHVLDILAGLVVPVRARDEGAINEISLFNDASRSQDGVSIPSERQIQSHTKVRLAHFSVKEYLESPRILSTAARSYRLDPGRDHRWITQSCIVYLIHWSNSLQKSFSRLDFVTFPLLEYAAAMWYRHALLQQNGGHDREMYLLKSETYRSDWLKVHKPDMLWREPFDNYEYYDSGSSLYYASFVGLIGEVQMLLDAGADVNARGGYYGNVLQAASKGGHEKVVQMLLDAVADVDALGGEGGNAEGDDASSVASHQSLQSVFSTGSITSSVSSVNEPFISDMENFVEISAQRKDLIPLLTYATTTMSQDKFARNNARLLRALSKQALASTASQAARLAGRVLRDKSKRLEVSRALFAHYCPDGIFRRAKLLPDPPPLHERLREYQIDPGLVTAQLTQDNAVLLQTPHGQAEPDSDSSGESSVGSEDEADDGPDVSDGLMDFVLSSDVFSEYVRNLRLFLHPVTPQLLFEAARHSDVQQVRELLEDALNSNSKTQPNWLEELVDLDLSTLRIAQLLVDQETGMPWIFSDFHVAHETPPATSYHQRNCIHNALAKLPTARPGSPGQGFIEDDIALDIHGQLQLRKDIISLCGLAGILPVSRNLQEWDGTVNFEHDQGRYTAMVSYKVDGNSTQDSICLTQRLGKICHRLENAIGLFQKSGICCSTFTVLRWNDTNVELCDIQVAIVVNLALLIGQAASDATGSQQLADLANHILDIFDPCDTRSREENTADAGNLLITALHRASVALQLLCLGFLSYSRGHAGELRPFFLEHSVHSFQLRGLEAVGQEAVHMTAQLVQLTCIGDMLQRSVLVFGPTVSSSSRSPEARVNVLASVANMIDVWGPGRLKTTPDLLNSRRFICAGIGGGTLTVSETDPDSLHWSDTPAPATRDSTTFEQGFDLYQQYVVGTLHINHECPMSRSTFKENYLDASSEHLKLLNTAAPAWRLSTRTLQAGGGQYITLGFGVGYTRLEGVSAKSLVLNAFGDMDHGLQLYWFRAYYGLKVSLCTCLAQRVSLGVLLADNLPAYVHTTCGVGEFWEKHESSILRALRTGEMGSLMKDDKIVAHQQDIRKLFHGVLHNLRNTGIDSEGLLRIAVRDQQCFKLNCVDTNIWATMLQDSDDDCATFAYVTPECLQNDKILCKSDHTRTWSGRSEVLFTEVLLPSARDPSAAEALAHGVEYSVGGSNTALRVHVDLNMSIMHPTLIVSQPGIFHKLRIKAQGDSLRRLRERGSTAFAQNSSRIVEVGIRAKPTAEATAARYGRAIV